jgi:L,D-transpeptidase ErfK/SrfK
MRIGKVSVAVVLIVCLILLPSSSAFARKPYGAHCVRVRDGQSWRSLFPDAHDREIEMRVNRLNTQIWGGMVIAVPNNLTQADVLDFAPFPHRIQSIDEKLIVVDPTQEAWGAYDSDGSLLRWGPISAGSDWCKDLDSPCHTRTGDFRIFSLGSSDCISHKFPLPRGGAPMPYCMYFNNGQALHGEPNGLPGYNASHGCVRLYVNDAEWLRYDFVEGPNSDNDYRGTRLVVKAYSGDDEDSSEE